MRLGPRLPSSGYRPAGRGPLLARSARVKAHRRSGRVWASSVLPVVIAGSVLLWVRFIGPELRESTSSKPVKAVTQAAGPANVKTPQPSRRASARGAAVRSASVSEVLLRVARDHVARRVVATIGSVPDLSSAKGADVDMIERALHASHFPLREAIIHHRFAAFRDYGLRRRPQPGSAMRKRVLTKRALVVFLDVYAQRLGLDWEVTGDRGFMPGDIVYVARPRGKREFKQFAVVSDRTDERGVSLLLTLDVRDRVAAEKHPLSRFRILRHYRLEKADLVHVGSDLGMSPPQSASRLL